ncbi:NACHT, LRR and PYD domains-containing protein 3-like [Dendropsophus ebraccatus]|uniref:NACHT, LRR and PYD domains-containing protein 3-like n=1 Tax=Dendropsophus ebraccatus TaxID=150705 RepID=UPI003831F4C2
MESDTAACNDDPEEFYQKISQYEDPVLRTTYKYFRDDLQHIMENLQCPAQLLMELYDRHIPDIQKYVDPENDIDILAPVLLEDIFTGGRDTMIALWASLYVVHGQKNEESSVLQAVLEELHHRGDTLVTEITLDEGGHKLPGELADIQICHKKHLYEKYEKLVENIPPICHQEEESFPLSSRYVNLNIVFTDQFRKRSEKELIKTGVKLEKYIKKTPNKLKHISLNKIFRWCHQSRLVPHMVMVSGVPGVGKTMLMQKFVYDWVRGDLYQRFSFVFFFKFRELNSLDEVSLETMILQKYPDLEPQIENILQDPEKLLFIFDGLDDSNHIIDFTSCDLCSNPRERGHWGQIVVSLVRKSLLNGCSVLMTSRPTRLASIDCTAFQRIVEITGFSPEERRTYFENFFPDPELAEKAFTYVKQNNTLYTFCYLPSYCWIICTVLSRSFQTTSSDQSATLLTNTMTQLFATFVANILANHSLDRSDAQKVLQSLGWMAEDGVMNHRVIFDDPDLDSFHVDNKSKLLSSFLMESGEPGTYTFLHLTVQEFLSALVHYTDYSPEKLQESLNKANSYPDGRGEIFLRFLFGLSDASTRSVLAEYLDNQAATQASLDVINWLRDFIPEQQWILSEHKEIYKKRFSTPYKKEQVLLSSFHYLFETQNKPLVWESLGSHTSFNLSCVSMSALDCTALAFILKTCTNITDLDLSQCYIDPKGLERLAPALHNIQNLSLGDNGLPEDSCIHLASIIRNNPTLKKLVLTENSLYGSHFRDLMAALSSPACKIEELLLDSNDLPDISCIQLASVIRNNRSLKIIDLQSNWMPGPHLDHLIEAMSSPNCVVEELQLTNTGVSDSSCIQLASLIQKKQTLRTLYLSVNKISGGPGFGEFMEALSSPASNLYQLSLDRNDLPHTFCKQLVDVLRKNQSLRILVLCDLPLSGPHFSDLLDALSSPACRIERLCVGGRGLLPEDIEALKDLEKHNPNLKII